MPTAVHHLLHTEDHAERLALLREAEDLTALYSDLLDRARAGVLSASPEARGAARVAAEAASILEDPRAEAAARRVEGQALRVEGRHAEAIAALEAAAEAARRANDPLLAAQVRIGQIDSLGWLGRVEDADALAGALEAEFLSLGAEGEAAKVLVNRGNLLFRRDEYADALNCYERAGEILERNGEEVAVARVRASRANILTHVNRIDEAIVLFRESGETFGRSGMTMEAAMGEGNVAFLEYLSGRMTAALSGFQRARQAFEKRSQEIEVAKADLDMGDIYRVLNLIPEALEHYERAGGVFERRGLPYERAKAEMGRGASLAAAGRHEEALAALVEADRLFDAQKNRLQRAHVALIRAGLLCELERGDEAREASLAAERAFRRYRLPGWAGEARYIHVRLDMEQGDESAARRMTGVARTARVYSRGWLECRAEEALARWRQARGEDSKAIRHYRRGVEALEAVRTQVVPEEMHVAFLRDKLGVYDGLISLLLQRGRPRDIRAALEQVERARSRILLERLEAALDSESASSLSPDTRHPTPDTLRTRIAELRAELNRVYHQVHTFDERGPQRLLDRPGGEAAVSIRLRALEEEYRRALQDRELASGAMERRLHNTANVDQLQASLDPDETLAEFYAGEGMVSAFLVTRERTRLFHRLASIDSVAQAARRLRYHLQRVALAPAYAGRHTSALHSGVTDVTACLYDLLWRPLERAIRTEKATVIPHGLLHGLPFHAFGTCGHAVLDGWELTYAPSAAFRIRRTTPTTPTTRATPSTLLIGVPAPGIEQVGSEIGALRKLLPGSRVLEDGQATLAAFRREAPGCGMLHLATHALYRADNPLFSGLRFSDGWLLARDLYDIRLDCGLATLSACQTGVAHVAPGDELFGLMRGFLAAGARSVAASFWPADDEATAELMVRFYRGISCGQTKAAALRAAQIQLRDFRPHPYFWAAFALTGER